jgi:protein-tyrosine phosphatase
LSLFSFLKKKEPQAPVEELEVDIHSHLIPGIDDGIQSVDEGIEILRAFQSLGYRKVITSPHTMWGTYNNQPEDITNGLKVMRAAIEKANLEIELDAVTEYYLDEHFLKRVGSGEELLSFGNKYVLVETGFMNEPPELKDASFQLNMRGYKMVYAHPERYMYLFDNESLIQDLLDRDVIFQMNMGSLTGHYGKPVQKFAEKLIDMQAIQLVGSDCHNLSHIALMKEARLSKYWNKLLRLELLNNKL